MKLFGLIGLPLTHSFSKKYFTEKFKKEQIGDCSYELFELQSIDQLPELISKKPELVGLNVTIPYKEAVMPMLDDLDETATKVGAVNVIKINSGKLKGFNSDYYGFRASLEGIGTGRRIEKAVILGTGGASKAVISVLKDLGADTTIVSRTAKPGVLTYKSLKQTNIISEAGLIVNTTPLGMYPDVNQAPDIPYDQLSDASIAFDLVYNPEITEFLRLARQNGATIKNGLEMLELQAQKSWEIWNA